MIKIDIFSGFLGAGKTTLIKKLIKEAYKDEKLVLIENEFGDIGIDGEFLKDSGVQINEMNSGCICCSLVGDFSKALKDVSEQFHPDRIIIEPSGVGKLSDVIKAVENAENEKFVINGLTTVVDAKKCKMYIKNFGEFFNDQLESAGCIVLSHTTDIADEKLEAAIGMIREHNNSAVIITTPWEGISGVEILKAIENGNTIDEEIKELEDHHHHECHCYEHYNDEECHCHDHEHHHHHDEECHCHDHEHHHHADDVFASCGFETIKKFTIEEMKEILSKLSDEDKLGTVLRAKGVVMSKDGGWLHFDYVPGEPDVRIGAASVCGRICVIGAKIDEAKIKELFDA